MWFKSTFVRRTATLLVGGAITLAPRRRPNGTPTPGPRRRASFAPSVPRR